MSTDPCLQAPPLGPTLPIFQPCPLSLLQALSLYIDLDSSEALSLLCLPGPFQMGSAPTGPLDLQVSCPQQPLHPTSSRLQTPPCPAP